MYVCMYVPTYVHMYVDEGGFYDLFKPFLHSYMYEHVCTYVCMNVRICIT
jgi:hypothetical protein